MKRSDFSNKVVLVTGGTGSIGSEIVKQLLKHRVNKIIVFSRDEIKQFVMRQDIEDPRLDFIMGDIRNYESIHYVFERYKIDIAFHAAAMKHLVVCEDEPIECINTNIIGTNNLMRLCIKYKVPKVIAISTDKAAAPTSVMGASKFISERITLNANLLTDDSQKFLCVRFGNVANSRGSVIPIMINRILNGKNIWISDPEVTRFIMRISDAVKLVFKAIDITKRGGELFVLKMPTFKLRDLEIVMRERVAPKLNKRIKVEKRGLVYGEKLHEDLLNDIECRYLLENDEMYIILNDIKDFLVDYPGFVACKDAEYNSGKICPLNLDELEQIVIEYLQNNMHLRILK